MATTEIITFINCPVGCRMEVTHEGETVLSVKGMQELLEAYHEVTGGEKRTIAIGGGTYAQSMEEGVAFGALFPGETEMAHQADEFIAEESVYQNARIFARAIVRLAGKKSEE